MRMYEPRIRLAKLTSIGMLKSHRLALGRAGRAGYVCSINGHGEFTLHFVNDTDVMKDTLMKNEIVERQLRDLVKELNRTIGREKIEFDQQDKVKARMSLMGGNGRLCVAPKTKGIDVSVRGQSVEKQLYPEFVKLFGRKHYGYKLTKPDSQAFWRVESFADVRAVAEIYAKTDR
jgi:hypothetical protein